MVSSPRLWTSRSVAPSPYTLRPVASIGWTCLTDGSADARTLTASFLEGGSDNRDRARGMVVALGSRHGPAATRTLLEAVRRAVRGSGPLVLMHSGAGGGSLLGTLRREHRDVQVLVIETAATPAAVRAACAHAKAPPDGDGELAIDQDGRATVPAWTPVPPLQGDVPLDPGDVVLITGGFGGLGTAVAGRLAERFGVRPVLADVADRPTPRAFQRLRMDVTDADEVRAALAPVAPAAILHCAGTIAGGPVRTLRPDDIARIAAPKSLGLRNVVTALADRPPRVVLAFGSLLSRFPHGGTGAYALANELLRREADRLAGEMPGTRFLTAEWTVWEGAGMAERMGAVGEARRAGYTPVPVADGVEVACDLLAWRGPETAVVVSDALPLGTRTTPSRTLATHRGGGR
jgi:hypothetical protein